MMFFMDSPLLSAGVQSCSTTNFLYYLCPFRKNTALFTKEFFHREQASTTGPVHIVRGSKMFEKSFNNENITKKLIKILQVGYFTLQQLCENSLQRQTQDLSKFQFSFEIAIATCFFGTISIIRQHIFENFLTHPPTLHQKKSDEFRLFLKNGIVIQKYVCP